MQGQAFKCNGCGRVVFVTDNTGLYESRQGPPPPGWFALSQVPDVPDADMIAWPVYHFDEIDCLAEFTRRLRDIPSRAVPEEDEPESAEVVPVEGGDEVVISEWDVEQEG